MRLSRLSVPRHQTHNIAHVQWREIYLDFSRFFFLLLAASRFIYTPTARYIKYIHLNFANRNNLDTRIEKKRKKKRKTKNDFCCTCVHIPSGTFNWIGERLIDKTVKTQTTHSDRTLWANKHSYISIMGSILSLEHIQHQINRILLRSECSVDVCV